jgi:hypothetical protein
MMEKESRCVQFHKENEEASGVLRISIYRNG